MSKIHVKKLMAFLIVFVMMIAVVPNICIIANADYENTHMNTGNQRVDIVEIAKTQIGYHEDANNDTKYNRWLGALSGYPAGGYGYAWCQSFVSWCAAQANVSTSEIKRASGTVTVKQSFINNGTYHKGPYEGGSYIPKSGDIIYFYSSGTSSKHHVGIVSGCDGSTVYTIEGNSSDMVCERSYSVNYGNIRGYGCPRYIEPDLKPPTYSNLTVDKTMIAVGEKITFTASSDTATGFTIGIYDGAEQYSVQGMPDGKLTFTFDKPGDYGAFVSAYNSIGYIDSNWVGVTVYDSAPTYSNLEADKTMIAVGEEITFTASSDYATGFTIGIDKDGNRIITQDLNGNNFTYRSNEAGNYYAYVTSWNGYGLCDSKGITFKVYDSKPTFSIISTDKTTYGINDDIIFKFESDTAIWYSVGIYKNGERIDSIWDVTDSTYTYHCTECGEYSAYVTSRNVLGWIDSERINFTVYASAPTYSNLEISKTRIAVGEEITFTALSDFGCEYWIGIDNEDSRYITKEMPDGQLTLSFDKAGSYSAYVTSSNSFGGKDSTLVYFSVYDPNKLQGDVNADGEFAISDIVLLQKWILADPDVKLANWKAADLCEDNRLDVFDMIEMRKLLIQNK